MTEGDIHKKYGLKERKRQRKINCLRKKEKEKQVEGKTQDCQIRKETLMKTDC